jgi:hypothetical protein
MQITTYLRVATNLDSDAPSATTTRARRVFFTLGADVPPYELQGEFVVFASANKHGLPLDLQRYCGSTARGQRKGGTDEVFHAGARAYPARFPGNPRLPDPASHFCIPVPPKVREGGIVFHLYSGRLIIESLRRK